MGISQRQTMSSKEFRRKIMRKNLSDIVWFYIIYVLSLIGGFAFAYNIFEMDSISRKESSWGLYFITIFFISSGIWGLYLIPKRYKVITVTSSLSNEQKVNLINGFITSIKNNYFKKEEDFYHFDYQKSWWRSSYSVYLTFDIDAIYLSIQSNTSRGIIDFGGTEKIRRVIREQIENRLPAAQSIL